MKRPTILLSRVLHNEGLQAQLTVSRDEREISRRFENEGMSFLTITLPSLCDALDQGLAQGRIAPAMFMGFKPYRRGGKLPALLSGFFMRVFDSDGVLLATPCIDSIRAIRQITRLFKKVELPCSPSRIRDGYKRYVDNDTSISEVAPDARDWVYLDRVARVVWSSLGRFRQAFYCLPGRFGPGATSERYKRNERRHIRYWYERLEPFFPASYHATSDERDQDQVSALDFLSEDAEIPVRVVQVPKTLKGPRTISVEPSIMMLCQQSIAGPLAKLLESGRLGFNSIRFSDQSVNRELARRGSIDGQLATIDLKDASDLVSNDLVKHIFQSNPEFLDFIQACRSQKAQLPNGQVLKLNKFASMGSALCFPIEAMVFFTLVMTALVEQSGRAPSTRLVRQLSKEVAVYGDDIIIPSSTVPGVIRWLEAFGLKVNVNKSFSTGHFRESCGGDYFRGHDVTPSYVRHWTTPGDRTFSAAYIASMVALSNQFYLKGLWHASQYIRDGLERGLNFSFARTRYPCGALTFASCCFNTKLRWESARSSWRVRGFKPRDGKVVDPIQDTRAAMLLCFLDGAHVDAVREFGSGIEEAQRASSPPGVRFTYSTQGHSPNMGWLSHVDTALENARRRRWSSQLEIDDASAEDLGTGFSPRPHALRLKRGWSGVHFY